eukprot:Gb_00411 [translate_table: standard]
MIVAILAKPPDAHPSIIEDEGEVTITIGGLCLMSKDRVAKGVEMLIQIKVRAPTTRSLMFSNASTENREEPKPLESTDLEDKDYRLHRVLNLTFNSRQGLPISSAPLIAWTQKQSLSKVYRQLLFLPKKCGCSVLEVFPVKKIPKPQKGFDAFLGIMLKHVFRINLKTDCISMPCQVEWKANNVFYSPLSTDLHQHRTYAERRINKADPNFSPEVKFFKKYSENTRPSDVELHLQDFVMC